jgi:LacI family gluconate utilization system Gnt-I transcriptional repressor
MSTLLGAHGYQLMLGISDYREATEEALIASFLAWSPAAIVLTGCRHSRQSLRLLLDSDIPIVEMWELNERPLDCSVGFSLHAVGRAVARHFVERGAQRPVFVGAALDRDYRAAERGAGFIEAIEAAGHPSPPRVALAERASVALGAQALATVLEQHPDTDAVFFSNDALALGGLFECQRRGVSVPGRLRICGFGDVDFAAVSVPTLTTIRPPRAEIGRRVAELLIERFNGTGQGETAIDLGFELIARESS